MKSNAETLNSSRHSKRVFVSAAELSGDLHAAKLIRAVHDEMPGVQVDGLGGEHMAAAGCELQENLVARASMLTHVVGQVWFFRKLLGRVKAYFDECRPDVVVLVDSPAWNFNVAKAAKARGIPVVHYIAPQLWAWGAWRCGKLRRLTDMVACILPFEQGWFEEHDIPARFVGHPLFDGEDMKAVMGEGGRAARGWNTAGDGPVVALLPGSREHEISKLFPIMAATARGLKERYRGARFITTTARQESHGYLREVMGGMELEIREMSIARLTAEADLTVVASGTATLEVAASGCPMLIIYDVPKWQWHLVGRWLIKTRYLSLVNILAGRELVPEFMPICPKPAVLVETAGGILDDAGRQERMRGELRALMKPLAEGGASVTTAELIHTMVNRGKETV